MAGAGPAAGPNRTVEGNDEAQRLHQQGRAAGERAKYAEALDLFAKAHEAAPGWAYPLYDAAFTYELMNQPAKALATYEEVLKLEPDGFFNTLPRVDCLRREAQNEWPTGVCKEYEMVEWLEPGDKRKALERLVRTAPKLAVAWKDLAGYSDSSAARVKMLDQGLALRPDPLTRGMLLINKAAALEILGKRAEANQILSSLVAERTAPAAVRVIAKETLSGRIGGATPGQ